MIDFLVCYCVEEFKFHGKDDPVGEFVKTLGCFQVLESLQMESKHLGKSFDSHPKIDKLINGEIFQNN